MPILSGAIQGSPFGNAKKTITVDVFEAIRTRHSVAKLGGDVPRDVIEHLLEAAVQAPNHRLTRPWKFAVIRGSARERADTFWAELAADAGERGKLLRAPVIVAVAARVDTDPVVAAEDHSATAAAIQNLLLAAHAHGLGAIWRTGRPSYHPEFAEYLGFDRGDRMLGLIYLGEPSADSRPVPLRPAPPVRWIDD
jgi:nitroreductase